MRKIVFPAAVLFVLLGISSVWADAVKESFTRFGGFNGSGAYEGTTVVRTQGGKQSEATAVKFTGAILSWAAGASETTTITRVDKGVVWVLDTKKKTYTENPIAAFLSDGQDSGEDMAEDDEAGEESPRVRVTRNEFKVRKTGASQTINGFACEEYLMTWLMEMEDLDTREKTRNTMDTNLWTTPETAALKKIQAEEAAFSKAYMKKIGMDFSPEEMKQFGMGVFAMASGASSADLEKGFKGLKKEMAKVKGYPIRTVVNWKVENDSTAAAAKERKESPVPSGAGDLLGGLGNIVSGAITQKAADSMTPDENAPFFSSTTEIKAISTDALPAETFEVPAGYKKQK